MIIPKLQRIGVSALIAAMCAGCTARPPVSVPLPPSACALAIDHATGAIASQPFTVTDGRIYVKAMVNDQGPFAFAIDTGASGMGRSDASLTKILTLPKSGAAQSSDGISNAAVDTVRINTLDVGGLVRRDLDIITRDYNSRMAPESAISGIIGRDFFADGLLIIDYPSRTVSFRRDRTLGTDLAGTLPYDRPFRVPMTIGTVATTGNLDTGANINFVIPRVLFDQLDATPPETAAEATLTNNRIATERATVKGPFQLGDISVSDVTVRVSDRFPEVLVGSYFLQNYIILIDQRSKRVAICDGKHRP